MLGYLLAQLVSKIFNLCGPDPPTSQTDRRTDRQTIARPRFALAHRAVIKCHAYDHGRMPESNFCREPLRNVIGFSPESRKMVVVVQRTNKRQIQLYILNALRCPESFTALNDSTVQQYAKQTQK